MKWGYLPHQAFPRCKLQRTETQDIISIRVYSKVESYFYHFFFHLSNPKPSPSYQSGLYQSLSCTILANPWTVAHQAPLSIHRISKARILKCVAISLLQGIFPTQGLNLYLLCYVFCTAGGFLTCWASRESEAVNYWSHIFSTHCSHDP